MQLEQYLEQFPVEQILVVDQHALLSQRPETLRQVFRSSAWMSASRRRGSTSPTTARPPDGASSLLSSPPARCSARSVKPRLVHRRRVPHGLFLLFSEELEPPVLADRQRARLVEYYAEDVARLRAFTGLPLESWSL
jgi:hypothetical protein